MKHKIPRCTKNYLKKIWDESTACWEQAKNLYKPKLNVPNVLSVMQMADNKRNRDFVARLIKNDVDVANILKLSPFAEEVDLIYRELLCKLPTAILEGILLAHNKKKQRRARKTIDSIHHELAQRILLEGEKLT